MRFAFLVFNASQFSDFDVFILYVPTHKSDDMYFRQIDRLLLFLDYIYIQYPIDNGLFFVLEQ
jgi:hypothetical protein